MIKYIGSKRKLIPSIQALIQSVLPEGRICDLFSGTARVSIALRQQGYEVWANDSASYASVIAMAYLRGESDARITEMLRILNCLTPEPGYFTETFCEKSRFFQPFNGAKVDAIRETIQAWKLEDVITPLEEAILLTSLLEAADRVDSTTGVQMAYLKQWAPRSFHPLELRELEFPTGPQGAASCCNANEFVSAKEPFDLVYLDPPYNQHAYRSNYHVWESLVRWDKPEVYGIACKRVDCQETKSPFNSKKTALSALESVVDGVNARYVLVSFNDEGFISLDQMTEMLGRHGNLETFEVDHDRYVGAKIGIHNLKGEKVGTVGKLKNKEYFYLLEKA